MILGIHCLDVSMGCWGPWHPAGNSVLHSDPHPSLESHGAPVKHQAFISIVCTSISFSTSQSHQEQNLKSVLSLSLPPWYVCVYIYVSMHVVCIHVLLSHACSEDEGGCHMSLPILLLIILWQDFPLNLELFWNPVTSSNPSGFSPHSTRVKGTHGPHSAFYIGA